MRAANRIVKKPYRYGGGHRSFRTARGYDCSGAVSYALHGAGLLRGSPRTSGGFMRWGRRGRGRWITVYAHGGHVYAVVAGLRFDTSMHDRGAHPGRGPRWSKRMRSGRGFRARHPRRL
jgi:cell wall-associated NlpC family hydrolase